MGLLDRARSFFVPSTAADLSVESIEHPVADANSAPRTSAGRDINPNELGGRGSRWGGYRESASALVNMFTGQGTGSDASSFNLWASPRLLSQAERFGMGRNALIQQALGKLPNTATRAGWRTLITDDTVEDKTAVTAEISAYETRLKLGQRINRALFKGRQYGQGMVILGIDDGQAFDRPVDPVNFPIKTIRWAVTLDSRSFCSHKLAPPTSTGYSEVEQFQITDINGILEDGLRYGEDSISYTGEDWTEIFEAQRATQGGQLIVHADRVLHFPTADYLPLLDSLQDSLGAYFEAMNGVRVAARESSLFLYKLNKLKQKMWSANANLAQEHMGLVQRAKSMINAIVVDSDEDVQPINRSLAGVADLPNPIMTWVAAALNTPNTILWQASPGGFGKGEAERDTYHEDANAFQDQVLTAPLTKAHGYILVAEDGPQLPQNTQREIKYNDLTPPDEEQRSKLRSEALSDLRQLHKDSIITRPEARAALDKMTRDEFFTLELDKEFIDKPATAPVGVFTATFKALESMYPEASGGIPKTAGRAALLALGSAFFNPDNLTDIIPIADPAEPTATGLESPDPADPLAPVDQEDGDPDPEPSDVEIRWSEVGPPPGAKTAKELASEAPLADDNVTSRQIKRLASPSSSTTLNAYKSRGFSKEPLFVLEEVQRALLERQGHMSGPEASDVRDVAEDSLCVMFMLPPKLARWVPYKSQDTSAPHVTLSYTKGVSRVQLPAVLDELRATFESLDPVELRVVGKPVHYFDTPKGRAYHVLVEFNDKQEYFDDMVDAFDSFGLQASTHGEYKPHVTLAYLDEGEEYDGPVPEGSWVAGEVAVTYGGELVETMTLDGRDLIDGVEVGSEPARDKGPLIKEGYIWRTQKDGKVRPEHKRLEGKRFRLGTGDPTQGQPGDMPNCRCAKQIIVPAKGTKRARNASERTTRRALRRNFERVSGPAERRAAKDATLTEDTVKLWLAEHISDARKMPRNRMQLLKGAEGTYPYLKPPEVTTVYRGLRNVKRSQAGKLVGMSDAVRDKSWTTDIAIAAKFATTDWSAEESDSDRVGVVLVADADPSKLLLNYDLLKDLPGVADRYHDRWEQTLAQAIIDEKEVLALDSLNVRTVKVVQMSSLEEGGEGQRRLAKDSL